MKLIKRVEQGIFDRLPPDNKLLYRFCRAYVDRFNGDNNDDMTTNGEFHLLKQVLPNCQVVFDVGANVGDWAALALSINPGLAVHCFEPCAATYQRLSARNLEGQVVRNNFGLSSAVGNMTLHVFADAAGTNSLYTREGLEDGWGMTTQVQQERIRLDTLDAYCQHTGIEVIDFLKVDVEGHELEVFKGAAGMLAQAGIKLIQFEYGGCNIDARVLLKDLFAFFQPFDYTFYKIHPREPRKVSRYDQRLENFQHQNWALVLNGYSLSAG